MAQCTCPSPVRTGPGGHTALTFLRAAGRVYGRVDRALAAVGLSYPQYRALERVRESDGWVLGDPSEAHDGVGLHGQLSVLEAKRLVRLVRDARGEGRRVELTPAGSAKALMAARRLEEVVGDFAATFNSREVLGLRTLLAGRTPESPTMVAGVE